MMTVSHTVQPQATHSLSADLVRAGNITIGIREVRLDVYGRTASTMGVERGGTGGQE